MEGLICQLCKEQISNPICIDCKAKNVESWLPDRLSPDFKKFHAFISHHFDSFDLELGGVYCLNCGTDKETSICIHCYLSEVAGWIKERDTMLSRKFAKVFLVNFVYKKEVVGMQRLEKLAEAREHETEFGICDDCGEFSDELRLINGRWMCSSCGI